MFDNKIMKIAIGQAQLAIKNGEVPVGAVVFNPLTQEILTQAYNQVEKDKNPIAHAEIIAIQKACNIKQSKSLEGLDLYITLQPCSMCLQAIIYSKIKRIYFGAYDPEIHLTLPPKANYQPEIYGGILEHECKKLLKDFFKSKR